jgi:hypothetical protein
VHECDTVAPATNPGGVIDEAHSLDAEVLEGFIDVGDGKSDMMHAFATPLQEPPHRRIWPQRLKQLNVRAADSDHCFLDALVRHHLAADRLDSVLIAELMQGCIQVVDGDRNVIDVVGEHDGGQPTGPADPSGDSLRFRSPRLVRLVGI